MHAMLLGERVELLRVEEPARGLVRYRPLRPENPRSLYGPESTTFVRMFTPIDEQARVFLAAVRLAVEVRP